MPIINVTLIEGRSQDDKRALIEELTNAAEKAIAVPRQSVRVIIWEVPAAHFGVAGVPKSVS
ncbi:2-hydroxymuconate tautomerase family protein [Zavarzinia aquatilis]|uniref:Tautomerase n=1 Tax=Zavarzinia aquatilis TaxID=2211142 RepID=A0A317DS63_9PROT|nr:2-hydroxymuconate tautomerase family protein [Zavarzinia aquatilis]PWR17518.1 4-oxalocrotonate tautomerase [Zavarzinia aquatilis]